ncbi:MAG: DUF4175 family protein [Emcibacter sp.]|nr:DUF4175 family protein [Emcibacter sp.]
MDGLEDTPTGKGRALFSGLLQAVALYLVYLALSLTDLWGYMPSAVQAVTYILLALAMMACIMRGLMTAPILSAQAGRKAIILSVLLLSIAGILAGSDSKRLLEIAAKPRGIFSYPVPEITLTVTPPGYSGKKEFTQRLTSENEKGTPLNLIPEGSEIMMQVENTAYAPTLYAGHQRVAFLSTTDGGFVARFTLKDEMRWQLREGTRLVADWPMIILEDDAPTIHRADFRQIMTDDGLFALSLDVSDDYELVEVTVGVMPSGGDTDMLYDQTTLAVSQLKEFSGELYVSLASSDFAGQKMDLVVEAVDQAGQKQTKIISGISLPLREFTNPLARKIIDIREGVRTQPQIRKKLARRLMALGLTSDNEQTSPIYYMALRSAYWRLTNPVNDDDINSARQILWHLANELEQGNAGQFNHDILALLASLKLALYQKQDLAEIRTQLQEIDKTVIMFLRHNPLAEDFEDYNVKELRKLYGKIMSHRHNKKTDQALDLVSYLEHGFIYRDKGILSGQGYARFQTIRHAQDQVSSLEKSQRSVMSFVYKSSVPLELASLTLKNTHIKRLNKDIQNWISLQKKLGVTVNDLGRTLLKNGIDPAGITVAANDLVQDAARSMEAGDMEAAAGYQSQIMTLLQSLKNILHRENRFNPNRPDDTSK